MLSQARTKFLVFETQFLVFTTKFISFTHCMGALSGFNVTAESGDGVGDKGACFS